MNNKIILKTSVILTIFLIVNTSIVLAIEYNLEYDANGNLIQGKDKYFEYNNFNQLFRVREDNQNGNILEEYFYDHEENRVLKKVYESGQLTQEIYYIDKNFIQIVNSTGTFNEVYYYDDSGLIAENGTDSRLKAYHSDHLGSTSLITNETGNVTELTEYEPYGSIIEGGNSRFTYTGKEKDATGLMYYGARNYNPEQGQFIQADKLLPQVYDPQQLNRYAYARNNPYKYVDPNGKTIVDTNIIPALSNLVYGSVISYEYFKLAGISSRYGKNELYDQYLQEGLKNVRETIILSRQIAGMGVEGTFYSKEITNYHTFQATPKETLQFGVSSALPSASGADILESYYNLKQSEFEKDVNKLGSEMGIRNWKTLRDIKSFESKKETKRDSSKTSKISSIFKSITNWMKRGDEKEDEKKK